MIRTPNQYLHTTLQSSAPQGVFDLQEAALSLCLLAWVTFCAIILIKLIFDKET